MLPGRIQQTIERYSMFARSDRILVGVSGGADSVCLLLLLNHLGHNLAVAHLNHGLRGLESDGDQSFVQELCARLGVPFFSRQTSISRASGNVEAAGRQARKEFF